MFNFKNTSIKKGKYSLFTTLLTKGRNPFFFLIWLLISISGNVSAAQRTTLYDFRYWSAPEHTRIVIDTQQNISYKIKQQGTKITLSIDNAKLLNRTYNRLFFQGPRINKVKVLRQQQTLHIFFHTKQKYQIKSFQLKPNTRYPHHRLVLDIFDNKVKKITKVKGKKIIAIDAGHGGEDSGATGYNNSKEKNITLAIAKKLAQKITVLNILKIGIPQKILKV